MKTTYIYSKDLDSCFKIKQKWQESDKIHNKFFKTLLIEGADIDIACKTYIKENKELGNLFENFNSNYIIGERH